MGLETATFIADLVTTNPPTSDLETQGASHLQLVKAVLQNVFGTGVRRYVGLPFTVSISANTTLTLFGAGNATHLVNTGAGAINITLPTLAAADAGWECSFIKTTVDVNPFFIIPPAGTIQSGEYTGLAKTRRCIPGRRTRVLWTGSGFIAERVNAGPVGSMINTGNATLAVGYEWPNGQTLSGVSGANYPEYFAVFGGLITPDIRGRTEFGLDNMGGAAAGRITVAGGNFDGTVNGGVGGLQNHVQTVGEMPAHGHTAVSTSTVTDPGHTHQYHDPFLGGVNVGGAGGSQGTGPTASATTGVTVATATTNANTGGGAAMSIMPPAITLGKLLIVE